MIAYSALREKTKVDHFGGEKGKRKGERTPLDQSGKKGESVAIIVSRDFSQEKKMNHGS